jgi:LacI family transcriptional regulator
VNTPIVTLSHVAAAARVSSATASRALNGGSHVRADLRERVLTAAEELGYAPNAHARALASSTTRVIGLICHDLTDPYFSGITGGVMRAADERKFQVIVASTCRNPDREVEYVSMMRGHRAKAILLVGSGFESESWQQAMRRELDLYRTAGGSVAGISRHKGLHIDTVRPANHTGAADLARELVTLGHRDFAVITGSKALTTTRDRVDGFLEGLAESDLRVRADRIVTGAFTRDGGYQAAGELLARRPAVTCLFAVTDIMAVGALAAVRDHGLSVPGDLSLAGFDDIPIVSDLTPPLTTVALPLHELGRRAVDMALRPGGGPGDRIDRLPARVILRASTASPDSRRLR